MLIPEQIAAMQKTHFDTFFGLANQIVDGVDKLIRLNMQTARSAMSDTLDGAMKLLSAKEPNEWLAAQNSQATQASCVRTLQAQWEAYANGTKAFAENLAKNAPVGSEAAAIALDSAFSAANSLYEALRKSGEQTLEITKSGFDVTTALATKSIQEAAAAPQARAAKR